MELKKKYELPRIKFVNLKGCDVIASSDPQPQSEDPENEEMPTFKSIWGNLALLPFILCLMLGISSCKENELPEPPVEELIPLSLSAEAEKADDDTRIKISPDATAILWEDGDMITLFDGKGNRKFTYSASDNKFHGEALSNKSYQAIYPYSSEASAQSSTLYNTVNISAEQHAIDGNFDKTSVPMIAYYSDNKLHFRWAYSLLKIVVPDGPSYSKIEISNYSSTGTDSYLAGTATISYESDVRITKSNGSPSITLLPAAGQSVISKGTYYVSILPCKLTGIQITCYNKDKIGIKRGGLNLEIKRHEGFELGTIEDNWFTCQAIDIGCIFDKDGQRTNYYIADRNLEISGSDPQGKEYSQADKADPATVWGPGWELPSTNVLNYWAGELANNDGAMVVSSFDEENEAYQIMREYESLTVSLPAPSNVSGNCIGSYWGNNDQYLYIKMSDTRELSKEIEDDSDDISAFIRPVFPVPAQ